MTWWLDVPLDGHTRRLEPTWGSLAQRFERCLGRVSFYVGQRVHDRGVCARIVTEAIENNVALLVAEHDELEELRRLRATADRLIASSPRALDR